MDTDAEKKLLERNLIAPVPVPVQKVVFRFVAKDGAETATPVTDLLSSHRAEILNVARMRGVRISGQLP